MKLKEKIKKIVANKKPDFKTLDFITKSKQSTEDSIRAKLAIMELLSKHGFSNYKMYFLNSPKYSIITSLSSIIR